MIIKAMTLFLALTFCAMAEENKLEQQAERFEEIITTLQVYDFQQSSHPFRTSTNALLSPEERSALYQEGLKIIESLPLPPKSKLYKKSLIIQSSFNSVTFSFMGWHLATNPFYIPGNSIYNAVKAAQVVATLTMVVLLSRSMIDSYKKMHTQYDEDFKKQLEPFHIRFKLKKINDLMVMLLSAYELIPRVRVEKVFARIEKTAECERHLAEQASVEELDVDQAITKRKL